MPDTCFNYLLWLIKCSHFQDYHTLLLGTLLAKDTISFEALASGFTFVPFTLPLQTTLSPQFLSTFSLIFTTELHTYKKYFNISLVYIRYIVCSGNGEIELKISWFREYPSKLYTTQLFTNIMAAKVTLIPVQIWYFYMTFLYMHQFT